MSSVYDKMHMPATLSVICPRCGEKGRFEHANVWLLGAGEDSRPYARSKEFDHAPGERVMYDSTRHKIATFYPGLKRNELSGTPVAPGRKAPQIDILSDKRAHHQLPFGHKDKGTIICPSCGLRRKHTLAWPADAWYRIEHRGQTLWAFTREHAVELLDYIRSERRSREKYRFAPFLFKVPSHFLTAKARADVTKKLEKLLAGS